MLKVSAGLLAGARGERSGQELSGCEWHERNRAIPLTIMLTSAASWGYGNPGATLSMCTLNDGLRRDSRPAALATVLVTVLSYFSLAAGSSA